MIRRIPVVERKPVTLESLLVDSCKKEGKLLGSNPELMDILTANLTRLISKLATGYCNNSINDFEDLVQACYERVWENRENYNPEVSKVSTWSWYVCRTILVGDYKHSKDYKEKFVFASNNDGKDFGSMLENSDFKGFTKYTTKKEVDGNVKKIPNQTKKSEPNDSQEKVSIKMAIEELYSIHGNNPPRVKILDAFFVNGYVVSFGDAVFRYVFPNKTFNSENKDYDLLEEEKYEVRKANVLVRRFLKKYIVPVFNKHFSGENYGF